MNRAVVLPAAAATLALATAAFACGLHDPSSIDRGMLNHSYPDALHVHAALWMAQVEGVIARDEQPAAGGEQPEPLRALAAYRDALGQLGLFRDSLQAQLGGAGTPAFSVVLVGPMLWVRFDLADSQLQMSPHVSGPSQGDVVVVTELPVLAALAQGNIGPREAGERGLLRFYGEQQGVRRIASLFDRLTKTTISKR